MISTFSLAQDRPLTFDEYNQLIIKYRFSKPDSALFYAAKALTLARSNKDIKGEAIVLDHWGIIDENQGRFDLGRQKYLQAINAYRKINFTEGVANETIRLGVTEMRRANFDKAIGYFLDALKIHERNGTKPGIMECYDVLGEAYMGQGNWQTALNYLNRGEAISRGLPLSGITLYIYNNLGVVHTNLGNLRTAMSYLRKSVDLSNEPQYAGLHITLMNSMAMLYTKGGQRDKAISLQLTALKKAREINNYLRELQTLNGLADNFATQDPDRALTYLRKAFALARQKNAGKVRLETLGRMAKIYEQTKNYDEALRITQQQHALADSIFNLSKVTEIANLEANYQLQRSQNNMERLRHLNKEQTDRQLITVGIALSTTLLLLVLAYYYIRSRSLNRQLSELNEQLTASNEVKDKLFSVIGHDLRAPMANLKNFLMLLNEEALTKEEQDTIIAQLIRNSDTSLGVLEQLLNWGQMQIKGILINPASFRAADIVRKNKALLSDVFAEKNIQVLDVVDPNVKIYADPDHFDIIIRNLLSNAAKFTPDGGNISIGNETIKTGGLISFYIKDTGIGMDTAHLNKIFERATVSNYGTRGEKGTGLGLLLCKEYVEANGGSITVTSAKGAGTTFSFTLPIASN